MKTKERIENYIKDAEEDIEQSHFTHIQRILQDQINVLMWVLGD